MGAIKSATSKEVIANILSYMETDSKYVYHESNNYEITNHTKFISNDEIEMKFLLNELVLSDVFILYAVHLLGYANIDMVASFLKYLHKLWPEKVIPYQISREALKSRIVFLATSSLLRGFQFSLKGYKGKLFFYSCANKGCDLIRRQLSLRVGYEPLFSLENSEEVLKRLSANSVALSLSLSPLCTEFSPSKPILDKRDNVKRKKCSYYARVKYTEGEKKSLVVVESVYFNTNPLRLSDLENQNNIIDRFHEIKEDFEQKKERNSYEDIVLCIVVENKAGFNRCLSLINEYIPELLTYVIFTSEQVLFKNKTNLKGSFLKVSIVEEKIKLSIPKYKFLETEVEGISFDNDNINERKEKIAGLMR